VLCTVAREQMEVGNYEGGCLALRNWWSIGEWPKLDQLNAYSAADLLFTAGTLADCMASTGQFPKGHKHSEALLNGSLALCALLALNTRVSEVRAELAACYYRQGFFDLARTTLQQALETMSAQAQELKSLCLLRLAVIDRHAGRLHDSINRLKETAEIASTGGPWIRGRYHQEFGTTQRHLAAAETRRDYFESALQNFRKAQYEFEAVGNHRYVAAVRNNIGFVLLALRNLTESETHLFQARKLFASFGDRVRCSQVDETLAQLYIVQGRFDLADEVITRSVSVLEKADEDALLAEALITHGQVLVALNRGSEAKRAFDGAHRIAERCGHYDAAGLALLAMLEALPHCLLPEERIILLNKVQKLLANSQQASIKQRIAKCLMNSEIP
jgi:tetratricopeptide (TPR) repeat protein